MEINSIVEILYQFGFKSISFYWLPILIWSILSAGFILFERHTNNLPPRASYQILTSLILALPLGLAVVFFTPFSVTAPAALQIIAAPVSQSLSSTPEISTQVSSSAINWHFYHLLGVITALLFLVSLLKFGKLIKESIQLNRMGLSIHGTPLSQANPALYEVSKSWGIRSDVFVVFSETAHIPMTFGWRRAVIIIPKALSGQQESLHMTLIHELSHIRNSDFIRQWIEKAVTSLFFFTPVVGLLAKRIDHLREMNCDWEVLNQKEISPKRYASLLLDFSSPVAAVPQLSLSMSANKHNLAQRIKAMKNYPLFAKSAFLSRKITFLLSALLLIVSTLIVACEIKFETDNSITIIESPAEGTQSNQSTLSAQTSGNVDDEVFMIVENMPQLVGGLLGLHSKIEYPELAKKAGIEGRVFVQFVVDTDGSVVDPVIVKGIGGGCDEEALQAIREAQFVPGRQGGQAVKVKMSLPIMFKLSEPSGKQFIQKQLSLEERAQQISSIKLRIAEHNTQLALMIKELNTLTSQEDINDGILDQKREHIKSYKEQIKTLQKMLAESLEKEQLLKTSK